MRLPVCTRTGLFTFVKGSAGVNPDRESLRDSEVESWSARCFVEFDCYRV